MSNYIRAFQPGGTFFFTVVTYHRRLIFTNDHSRSQLRTSIDEVRKHHPFDMPGMVLLPNHLHCIWILPQEDHNYSLRWQKIKEGFTRTYLSGSGADTQVSMGQQRKRMRGVWQPRFWEHTIRDDIDYERHMDYIHYNPVKHGYTNCPHEWIWSSFHRWVKEEYYSIDWCCQCENKNPKIPKFDNLNTTAME